jgi:hypothetical protein
MVPIPPEERLQFFVYVVESPSAVDIYHDRGEARLLATAVSLNQIPAVTRVAISRDAFEAALTVGLPEEMSSHSGLIPIVHISAHGDGDGIQLSSGEVIQWHELRELLKPINKALDGNLLVCMSCCEGYAGVRMAMHPGDPEHPYFALVGNMRSPTWSETAVAYATFYHLIAKGEYIPAAVAAMRMASGNDQFVLETSEQSQKAYVKYLEELDSREVEAELRDVAQDQSPSDLAKTRGFKS